MLSSQAGGGEMFMWEAKVFLAKQYINRLTDDAVRSMNHKIEHGQWVSKAPLGYLNTKDPVTGRSNVIVDPERAFFVKKLFQEYATGTVSLSELRRRSIEWDLRTIKGFPIAPQTLHKLIQNPFYRGVMVIKGVEHPHSYPPIIDKALFDACQDIRLGKGRTGAPRDTEKPFALRGLMRCATSGRRVTCDLKKGKYVYLICQDPARPQKRLFVPEGKVMAQIEAVFRSLQIPADVLAEITDYLRQTHEAEKAYHHQAIARLHRESTELTKKLDRLTDLLIDESITKDEYDKKRQAMIARRAEVNQELEGHHAGDDQFKIALTSLVTLASRSWEIFERSTIAEKRKLIGFVFSNLELKGATLCYTLKKPFDLFVNLAENNPYGIQNRHTNR